MLEEKLKPSYMLKLKSDFYSLAFYGYYLDTDEEDIGPWYSTKQHLVHTKSQVPTIHNEDEESCDNSIYMDMIKKKLKKGISNEWLKG